MGKLWVLGFFLFFAFATTNLTSACFEHEKGALLRFQNSLVSDPSGQVSLWSGNNCCQWQGVSCDNSTGHVIRLELGSGYSFYDEEVNDLNLSLAELTHLTQLKVLNLSAMGFSGIVPQFIGNLSNLRVLDLSEMELVVDNFTWFSSLLSLKHLDLSGLNVVKDPNVDKVLLYMISSLRELRLSCCSLSNSHFNRMYLESNLTLSTIQTLDLSSNLFHGEFPLFLQNLTSLRVLDLSYNSLNSTIPFMNSSQNTRVWRLCQLKRLDISSNFIQGEFRGPSTSVSECAHFDLEILNLNHNDLGGEIPASLGRLMALKELNLGSNKLIGTIPEALGNLKSLQELDLSENKLTGIIPTSIGNLLLLRNLYLSSNFLNGTVPFSLGRLSSLEIVTLQHNYFSTFPSFIGNLSELKYLDISDNLIEGPIPTIAQLSKLGYLDISNNLLSGVVTEAHFANTSMLKYMDATSNYRLSFKISNDWKPRFQIETLRLRACIIKSEFPQWIRTQTRLRFLILSNTSIYGPLPDWLGELSLVLLDLSHNFLNGPLTNLPSNQTTLQNSGSLYSDEYNPPYWLYGSQSIQLLLKNNLFNGPIPYSLCNVTHLNALDLSRNMLSGTLPGCFGDLHELYTLILSSNRLSGVIPSSLCNHGYSLLWLSLNNNSFHGQLPQTLTNCSVLALLDLGENQFFGSIPKWIGENITSLNILRLHKNKFTGPIPVEWGKGSTLQELQILDLGENKLTGTIPRSFQNFSRMMRDDEMFSFPGQFEYSLSQVMKGTVLEYTTTLRYVVNIDLSSNKLVGEIPKELVLLSGLLGLNLSNNHLTGWIPDRIGDMNSLMSLDLSLNNLSGMIPQSLSALTFLSHLNLSHNNLSGQIPTGRQLQTLNDPSIYSGNNELCGSPLQIECNRDHIPEIGRNTVEDEDSDGEIIWIYGATVGFTTGFMGIVGFLVLKKRWRLALFNFVGYYIGNKL